MRLHERFATVNKANNELGLFLIDWIEKHDLTYIEAIRCLQEHQSRWLTYVLRDERHPDHPHAKADEAFAQTSNPETERAKDGQEKNSAENDQQNRPEETDP